MATILAAPGEKRRSDVFACDLCSRKKSKCDGKFPICTRCEKAGKHCTFTRESVRKSAQRDYMKFLEQRANALLAYISHASGVKDERVLLTGGLMESMAAVSGSPTATTTTTTTTGAPLSARKKKLMELGAGGLPSGVYKRTGSFSAVNTESMDTVGLFSLNASPAYLADGRYSSINSASSHVGGNNLANSTEIHGMGPLLGVGAFSGFGPVSGSPQSADNMDFGSLADTHTSVNVTNAAVAANTATTTHNPINSNEKYSTLVEPRTDLLDDYFRLVAVHAPLLHHKSFLQTTLTESPLLMYAMYAFASNLNPVQRQSKNGSDHLHSPDTVQQQQQSHPDGSPQSFSAQHQQKPPSHQRCESNVSISTGSDHGTNTTELGIEYYRMARHCLDIAVESPSISHLVGILFLVWYSLARGSALGLYYMGVAVRMAQQLHLHQEPPDCAALPPMTDDQELRRRVWWAVFELDRRVSFLMGVPFSVNEDDIGVGLPLFHYFSGDCDVMRLTGSAANGVSVNLVEEIFGTSKPSDVRMFQFPNALEAARASDVSANTALSAIDGSKSTSGFVSTIKDEMVYPSASTSAVQLDVRAPATTSWENSIYVGVTPDTHVAQLRINTNVSGLVVAHNTADNVHPVDSAAIESDTAATNPPSVSKHRIPENMVHPRHRHLKLISIFGKIIDLARRFESDPDTSDIERSLLNLSLNNWVESLPQWMRVGSGAMMGAAVAAATASMSMGSSARTMQMANAVEPTGMTFSMDPFSQDPENLPWSVCVMHITYCHARIVLNLHSMRKDVADDVFGAHLNDAFEYCLGAALAIGKLFVHIEYASRVDGGAAAVGSASTAAGGSSSEPMASAHIQTSASLDVDTSASPTHHSVAGLHALGATAGHGDGNDVAGGSALGATSKSIPQSSTPSPFTSWMSGTTHASEANTAKPKPNGGDMVGSVHTTTTSSTTTSTANGRASVLAGLDHLGLSMAAFHSCNVLILALGTLWAGDRQELHHAVRLHIRILKEISVWWRPADGYATQLRNAYQETGSELEF